MAPDPKAADTPSVSPYVYCNDNPVSLVDPDGKAAKLAGSTADRMTSLGTVQQLTNDQLYMRYDGSVVITGEGGANSDTDLSSGTGLVRDVVGNDKTVTIFVGTGGNVTSPMSNGNITEGMGSDSRVRYDPTSNSSVPTTDPKTGNSPMEPTPPAVALGHELVHADRNMHGQSVDSKTQATNTYKDGNGKTVTEKNVRKDELQTIGIQSNSKYTENKLREEQGLNQRGGYGQR